MLITARAEDDRVNGDPADQRQRVRLQDIAHQVNVSRSTASRALAGDQRISAATREAVIAMAAELRYVPNAAARSLRMRHTRALGLLVPDLRDPVHGQVASTFEQEAGERGYCVILVTGRNEVARERLALKVFAEHGTDGVAIVSSVVSPREARERVSADHLVFVQPEHRSLQLSDRPLPPGVIRMDDAQGTRAAVDHLVDNGYRRIAYVASGVRASNTVRAEAFKAAVRERGLPPPRIHSASSDAWRDPGDLAAEIAADPPEALVCYDDKLALALMDALRGFGLVCPRDIGIVGFDGISFAELSNPRLTTVVVPSGEMGRLAAASLIDAIQGGTVPDAVVLPAQLIAGESTRTISLPEARMSASA
jgi:LacI family transcriptional regulator